MLNKFEIRVCSDLDYEEMVIDILYEREAVALISQENGIENMAIEILPFEEKHNLELPLDGFMEILQKAKERLIKIQRSNENES